MNTEGMQVKGINRHIWAWVAAIFGGLLKFIGLYILLLAIFVSFPVRIS